MSSLSDQLAQARFEAAVGTSFDMLSADGQSVAMVLHLFEVSARRSPRDYEQYSALFRGPAAPLLPQATYAFRHPTIGELALFIVPISRDDEGVVYEACVSRRVGSPAEGASTA
jgi:hypothetical protein